MRVGGGGSIRVGEGLSRWFRLKGRVNGHLSQHNFGFSTSISPLLVLLNGIRSSTSHYFGVVSKMSTFLYWQKNNHRLNGAKLAWHADGEGKVGRLLIQNGFRLLSGLASKEKARRGRVPNLLWGQMALVV